MVAIHQIPGEEGDNKKAIRMIIFLRERTRKAERMRALPLPPLLPPTQVIMVI